MIRPIATLLLTGALTCAPPSPTPSDAGTETPDAGAEALDGGTPGAFDAGTPDTGTPDTGTPDTDTPDAGTIPPDAGTSPRVITTSCPQVASYVALQRELATARCRHEALCGVIGASEEAPCIADALAAIDRYEIAYRPDEAIAAGRVGLDCALLEACLTAAHAATCASDWEAGLYGTCYRGNFNFEHRAEHALAHPDGMLAGLVGRGDACQHWGECARGAWCANGGNGQWTQACGGRCEPYTPIGQRCWGHTCGPEAFCDSTDMRFECVAYQPIGARCSLGSGGPTLVCGEGHCAGWIAATATTAEVLGTCTPRVTQGGACVDDGACEWGLSCAGSTCVDARPPPLAEGAACTANDRCADGLTCVGLDGPPARRTGTGRCEPFGDANAACDPTHATTNCPASQACDRTSRTCVPATDGVPGDACELGVSGCRGDHAYCDANNRCAIAVPLGGACTPTGRIPGADPQRDCYDGYCDEETRTCVWACL